MTFRHVTITTAPHRSEAVQPLSCQRCHTVTPQLKHMAVKGHCRKQLADIDVFSCIQATSRSSRSQAYHQSKFCREEKLCCISSSKVFVYHHSHSSDNHVGTPYLSRLIGLAISPEGAFGLIRMLKSTAAATACMKFVKARMIGSDDSLS